MYSALHSPFPKVLTITVQDEPGTVTIAASKKLYGYVWRNSAPQQFVVCAVALVTLPLTLAPIELQRRIIDDAVDEKNLNLLFTLIAVYAAVIALQQIVKYSYNYLGGRLSARLIRGLREKIFIELADDAAMQSSEDGAVVSMLTAEVKPIGGFGGSAFALLITEGGVLLSVMGYMLFTQLDLAIVAILAFIPQAIATPMVQKHINQQSAEQIGLVRSVGDDALAEKQEHPVGGTGAKHRIGLIYLNRLIINRLKFSLKAILNVFDHLADLAVLGCGGYLVIVGQTDVGVVVAFLSGLGTLRSPWRTLISYFRLVSDATLRFKLLSDKVPGLD